MVQYFYIFGIKNGLQIGVSFFSILNSTVYQKGHMHLNRKKLTIPEVCLNFHELLEKLYQSNQWNFIENFVMDPDGSIFTSV